MSERRIAGFFYGLFMDIGRGRGIQACSPPEIASADSSIPGDAQKGVPIDHET